MSLINFSSTVIFPSLKRNMRRTPGRGIDRLSFYDKLKQNPSLSICDTPFYSAPLFNGCGIRDLSVIIGPPPQFGISFLQDSAFPPFSCFSTKAITSAFLNRTVSLVCFLPIPGHGHRTHGSCPRSAIRYTSAFEHLNILETSVAFRSS